MRLVRALFATMLVILISVIGVSAGAAAPEGQLTWALGASIAPTWFDPAETSGIITPYIVLFALHDGLVKCEGRWARRSDEAPGSRFEMSWFRLPSGSTSLTN